MVVGSVSVSYVYSVTASMFYVFQLQTFSIKRVLQCLLLVAISQ